MGVSGYTAVANCYAQQGDYEAVDATFDEMMRKVSNVPVRPGSFGLVCRHLISVDSRV